MDKNKKYKLADGVKASHFGFGVYEIKHDENSRLVFGPLAIILSEGAVSYNDIISKIKKFFHENALFNFKNDFDKNKLEDELNFLIDNGFIVEV